MTSILAHLAWESTWFGLAVWGVCCLAPRLTPATRCILWWAVCMQMQIACIVVLSPILSAGSRILPIWLGVWCVGIVMRLVLLGRQYCRARSLVRAAVPLPPCAALEMLTRLGTRLGLKQMPGVRVSPGLPSPVLAGPWRPVLLLPITAVEDTAKNALQMAAAHELAHLRRRDLALSLAPVSAEALLWWHPLVWLAVREYMLAREEACDAEARHVTGTAPDEYGAMLLDHIAPKPVPAPLLRSPRAPYRSLLRRLNAMRIPYEQPRQGPVGAFCSVCILVTAAISAYPLLQSPSPTAAVAVVPEHHAAVARVASSIEIYPLPVSRQKPHPVPIAVIHRERCPVPLSRVCQVTVSMPAVHSRHSLVKIAFAPHHSHTRLDVPEAPDTPDTPVTSPAPVASPATVMLRVADDVSPTPVPSLNAPDLSQMRSGLQAMKQQIHGQQMPLPNQIHDFPPVLGKDFAAQMQAQFGPQFQERLNKQMREQFDRQLPILRAQIAQSRRQAEQAARDAVKQQRAGDRAMQEADIAAARAEAQAFEAQSNAAQEADRETAQAAAQAFEAQGLAEKARRDALKELQKELPQIEEDLKTDDAP